MDFLLGTSGIVWANQPAAVTEFYGVTHQRSSTDTSAWLDARLVVYQGQAAASGAHLAPQYSTDGGSTWLYFDGSASGTAIASTQGPWISLSATGTTWIKSSWYTLPAAVKGDYLFRLVADLGDGVADPAFTRVHLQGR